MAKIERRLELWGGANLSVSDPEKVLKYLFIEKDMSLAGLCRTFEVSRPAMAACLRRHGFELKSVGQTKAEFKAKARGYEDIGDFFEKNWNLSFREMARKLNLSVGCLRKEYKVYIARRRAEEQERKNHERTESTGGDTDSGDVRRGAEAGH